MKYLILIVVLLTGCGYRPGDFTEGAVISAIEAYDDGCVYYTETAKWYFGNFKNNKAYFYDVCGKFTVGDTVLITKK